LIRSFEATPTRTWAAAFGRTRVVLNWQQMLEER